MSPPPSQTLSHPLLSTSDRRVLGVSQILAEGDTGLTKYRIVRFAAYGRALLIDGLIQSCEFDEGLYHEMLVSPACALHGRVRNVVLVGGANGGIVNRLQHLQALRAIRHVDRDPTLHRLCTHLLPHLQPTGPMAFDYGLSFEPLGAWLGRESVNLSDWADLVLLDLPDAQEGTETQDVLSGRVLGAAAGMLAPGGVLITHVGHGHPMEIGFQAESVATLRRLFSDVVVYDQYIPSLAVPWSFAIASRDRCLDGMFDRAMERRIETLPAPMRRHYDYVTHRNMLNRPRMLRVALDAANIEAVRADPSGTRPMDPAPRSDPCGNVADHQEMA